MSYKAIPPEEALVYLQKLAKDAGHPIITIVETVVSEEEGPHNATFVFDTKVLEDDDDDDLYWSLGMELEKAKSIHYVGEIIEAALLGEDARKFATAYPLATQYPLTTTIEYSFSGRDEFQSSNWNNDSPEHIVGRKFCSIAVKVLL